jgi:hypothetical protein
VSSGSWRWRQIFSPKRWYPATSLLGVATQKTTTWIFKKVKVKLSLCLTKHHDVKMYWESGGIQTFFDLGTRCRWVVSFTPRPLYPQGKNPRYPLDRRLGGPQSRFGHSVEEKNSQPSPGIETRSSDHPAHSQSLYRLSYPGSDLNLHLSKSHKSRSTLVALFLPTHHCMHLEILCVIPLNSDSEEWNLIVQVP